MLPMLYGLPPPAYPPPRPPEEPWSSPPQQLQRSCAACRLAKRHCDKTVPCSR